MPAAVGSPRKAAPLVGGLCADRGTPGSERDLPLGACPPPHPGLGGKRALEEYLRKEREEFVSEGVWGQQQQLLACSLALEATKRVPFPLAEYDFIHLTLPLKTVSSLSFFFFDWLTFCCYINRLVNQNCSGGIDPPKQKTFVVINVSFYFKTLRSASFYFILQGKNWVVWFSLNRKQENWKPFTRSFQFVFIAYPFL